MKYRGLSLRPHALVKLTVWQTRRFKQNFDYA